MIGADRRADESWSAYWARKHDEEHGRVCACAWNRVGRIRMPLPSALGRLDSVPAGKRVEVRRGAP